MGSCFVCALFVFFFGLHVVVALGSAHAETLQSARPRRNMPKNQKVVSFSPIASCASTDTRSVLQEFEETLAKIRKNAAGDRFSFWNAGLNDEDCLRLCEALKVAIQPNKQYIGLSLAGSPSIVAMSCLPMLVSAGFCLIPHPHKRHPHPATSSYTHIFLMRFDPT